MPLKEEECKNAASVLEQAIKALKQKDPVKLKELSNRTIHSASVEQNPGSITSAVIIYTLSKLIEREDYRKIKRWDSFVKKFNSNIDLAVSSISKDDYKKYKGYIENARKILTSYAVNLRPYIQDVLRKASINKGSKIYEHGVSLERTASLLGVTQWELSDYIGQTSVADIKQNQTIDVQKRARIAMDFFGVEE